MTHSQEPRWWRRRRDLALFDARSAQGTAAVALLELDDAQRATTSHLEFVAGVDGGRIAKRLRQAWAPVDAAADATVAAYLEATSRWDVEVDLDVESASAAAVAFRGHAERLQAATTSITEFNERFASDFAAVGKTLQQVADSQDVAAAAVASATAAVEAAEAQGLRATRARKLLASATEHLTVARRGPAQGLDKALAAGRSAQADATEAEAAARRLPADRDHVAARITALRTRLDAVAWRVDRGNEAVLRILRRGYAAPCSEDLEDATDLARTALAAARRDFATAEQAGTHGEQRWDEALAALVRTRDALAVAEEHLDAPRDRLALLKEVSADPDAAFARARFVVRDAQKLLMAGPVDARAAAQLDALAARLDTAREPLHRPHPDWLAYARNLDAIADSARGLVVDIRASRAR